MKEYKVDTLSVALKTRSSLESSLQKLIDERVEQGYILNTLKVTMDIVVVVFEREKTESKG